MWHVKQSHIRSCTAYTTRSCTPDLVHQILYSIHNTATDRRWERSQLSAPPAIKQAPLTMQFSSLRCVSAAEHHNAEQYSKTGKTKPPKHLSMSNLSWNTRQDFLKIPRSTQNQMSLPIYPDRQTPPAQYRLWLMGVTGDALCVTWSLSQSWSYSHSISSPKGHTTHSL